MLSIVEIPSSQQFMLFGTVGCHLCEQAEQLLLPVVREHALEVELVDVSEHDALLLAYGVYIPVLRQLSTGREWRWPFSADALREALSMR
jgi:hypothetical protein